jgi:hypothetical protein
LSPTALAPVVSPPPDQWLAMKLKELHALMQVQV